MSMKACNGGAETAPAHASYVSELLILVRGIVQLALVSLPVRSQPGAC